MSADPEPAAKKSTTRGVRAFAEMKTVQQQLGLLPLDPHQKKPSRFAAPIFISIDCEAYEFSQHKITELGVSVLDTRDLRDLQPNDEEAVWVAKIHSEHYRVREYAKLVNKRYVKGCPNDFEFGRSTWIGVKEAKQVLRRIFQVPTQLSKAAELDVELQSGAEGSEKRNLVLVGHGLGNDTKYLKTLGFSPFAFVAGLGAGSVLRTADTQVLAGSTKKQTVGLARLLKALDIEARHLHNAGNDATYTLQALVLKARRDFLEPGAVEEALGLGAGAEEALVNDGEKVDGVMSRRDRKLARRAERRATAGKEANGTNMVK